MHTASTSTSERTSQSFCQIDKLGFGGCHENSTCLTTGLTGMSCSSGCNSNWFFLGVIKHLRKKFWLKPYEIIIYAWKGDCPSRKWVCLRLRTGGDLRVPLFLPAFCFSCLAISFYSSPSDFLLCVAPVARIALFFFFFLIVRTQQSAVSIPVDMTHWFTLLSWSMFFLYWFDYKFNPH